MPTCPAPRRAATWLGVAGASVCLCALGGCTLLVSTSGLAGDVAAAVDDAAAGDASLGGDVAEGGAASSVYVSTVLTDGPISYWRLDETSGTTAANEIVQGPAGVYQGSVGLGAPGALGDDGRSVALSGTGGVLVGDAFDFVGTAPFTLEAWISPALLEGGNRRIVDKEKGDVGYRLIVGADNGLNCSRCSGTACTGASTAAPPTGTFTHVACVFDGERLLLYVNGAEAARVNQTFPVGDTTVPFQIGAGETNAVRFVGRLDEVALYDKALAPDRVRAHYQASGR